MGPCLRQQQRSRCGIGVRKMQIERALVAGEGGAMLPASQKFPKLAFVVPEPCLQQRIPRGSIVALLAEASGSVTCCCEGLRSFGRGL